MAKSIRLRVLAPTGDLFCGEVAKVSLPGTKAPFVVLPGHAPIISSLEEYDGRFAFKHNALPDESWDYAECGIPSLTLCVPVGGELHSDAGVLLRKESALEYCRVLPLLAGLLR